VQSYKPALDVLNQVDADVITFEMKSSNAMDLADVGERITGKKVGIGVITTRCRSRTSSARSSGCPLPSRLPQTRNSRSFDRDRRSRSRAAV
jgi:hypothetical protein